MIEEKKVELEKLYNLKIMNKYYEVDEKGRE